MIYAKVGDRPADTTMAKLPTCHFRPMICTKVREVARLMRQLRRYLLGALALLFTRVYVCWDGPDEATITKLST